MKLQILICAYVCLVHLGEKLGGGGDRMSWNVIKRLGGSHLLWVLTSVQNRAAIEAALQEDPLPNVKFQYVDLPVWLHALQRFQGGVQLYAYLWQLNAYFVARKLHQQIQFDGFHHLTYTNDWMASFIGALLPVPYIRGPGGGAHRIPKPFLREYPPGNRLWEWLRVMGQWVLRHDPFFIMGQRRARAILVANREALRAIPRQWQHKAHLFPLNGVSSDDFLAPGVKGAPGGKFRVLSAGRLIRIKGFGLAIRAFRTFVERCAVAGSAGAAELTIVGEGPELPRLEALVRELGLESQVRFQGWMPRQQLLREMSCCDVFLFLSLRDGGGAVVVEAMAAGKPVICLDLAGPGMHVTEECGIKVSPRSVGQAVCDTAAALNRLYRDEELRSRMGRAARERAEQVYHWDRLAERVQEIYRHLLWTEG